MAKVMTSDARRNLTTNFGKRHQICAASAFRPVADFSHTVMEIIESTKAQMPIQTSRPMTLIKV